MILIKSGTTYIDTNKNSSFDLYVNTDTILYKLISTNKVSNEIIEITGNCYNYETYRYFRMDIDFDSYEFEGTYSYEIELYNNSTEVYDSYQVGILQKEILEDDTILNVEDDKDDIDDDYILTL